MRRWLVLLLALPALPALGQDERPADWPAVKCARYREAFDQAIARQGSEGLSDGFLASHKAFIEAGCTERGEVCPRSAEEFRLANTLVILGMNRGMASTFFPFRCPPAGGGSALR